MANLGIRLNRQIVKHVFASVDFGYINPGVIQVWLVVGSDETMILIREVYRTQRTIDWWIEQGKRLMNEWKIEVFVCDPSEPSYIAQLNEAGLPAIKAINDIAPGINAMQRRLQHTNGRPRLLIYTNALVERDAMREEAHQALCFEHEISEYVWAKEKDGQPLKELPIKLHDHSMDAARYAVMYMESIHNSDVLDHEMAEAITQFRGL